MNTASAPHGAGGREDPLGGDAAAEARQRVTELERRLPLTDQDKRLIDAALLTGGVGVEFHAADNPQDALFMFEARQAVWDAEAPIRQFRQARAAALGMQAAELADIIAEHATDKHSGLQYQRETMERNIYDIFGKAHRADAERLIAQYLTPVHKAVADGNRLKERLRGEVSALRLNIHERALVQMTLENRPDLATQYVQENGLLITPAQSDKITGAVEVIR